MQYKDHKSRSSNDLHPRRARAQRRPGFALIRAFLPHARIRSGAALWTGVGLVLGLLIVCPAQAQNEDRQAQIEQTRQQFDPPVVRLADEVLTLRARTLQGLCPDGPRRETVARWLIRRGAVILDDGQADLTLHYFAEGIAAMTATDRAWEGLPRRANSLQDLVDHAITRSRAEARPITTLIITGHAGLPGCAALGGTIDDCVFEGKLTDYQRRQLVRLRPYLASDATIELRQCVTGSGKEGQRLLTAIHQTTGAAAVSYLADFHFGDSAAHSKVRVDREGFTFVKPR